MAKRTANAAVTVTTVTGGGGVGDDDDDIICRWWRWLVLVDWCCTKRVVADYGVGGGGFGVAAGVLARKK
nr:hypothetical protein [Tanacetum cinerariifolium]